MGESSTMRTCNGFPVTNAVSKFSRLITLTLSFPNDGLGATPAHLPSFSMPKDEAMGKSSAKERRPDSIVALSCNSSSRCPAFRQALSRSWTVCPGNGPLECGGTTPLWLHDGELPMHP